MSAPAAFKENPLRFFGGVFVLNLPARTDRLSETRRELARLHPDAAVETEVFPGVQATEAYGFPSVGAYGCFQGHLGILREARDRGLSSVLILEDDVRFDPAVWHSEWPAVAAALEAGDWDLVNLGFENVASAGFADGPLVSVSEPLMLAHCYAVNGRVIAPLVAFLEAMLGRPYGDPAGGPMHFDGALHHFARDVEGIRRYRTRLSLAGQRSSRSDIAGGRWFDRKATILRRAAEALRAMKNKIQK